MPERTYARPSLTGDCIDFQIAAISLLSVMLTETKGKRITSGKQHVLQEEGRHRSSVGSKSRKKKKTRTVKLVKENKKDYSSLTFQNNGM